MAPIQIPTEDTRATLQNVLNQRTVAQQALKERNALTGRDYQDLEDDYNKTSFIQPLDATTTKAAIYYTRRKWTRYCAVKGIKSWKNALLSEICNKGVMMGFLRWICETYIVPKQAKGKRAKRKSVNQYWRDFKMLYRRINGTHVNANDSLEVVKYINGALRKAYDLDGMPKPKPLAGPDTLLLILTQHWARDKSIFRTEEDRLDFATILLFLGYSGGRPAEFVQTSKCAASQDPLGKDGDTHDYEVDGEAADAILEDLDEDLFDDHENVSGSDLGLSDSSEEESSNFTTEKRTDGLGDLYSDRDRFMTEDEVVIRLMEDDEASDPVNTTAPGGFEEERRKWRTVCYEDICIWIVQNPRPGERDVLAMEVCLRNHKGADLKPKPTIFLFRENALPIFCPISHVLARAIRDNAVLVEGYTSPEPFFATNLRRMGMKAMRVNWKPEWLKRPIFRKSVLKSGVWVKSKTEPFDYSLFNFCLQRCGKDGGLEDIITSYCFRRALLNAANGVASDAVRDQIARHNPGGGVFNFAYLNEAVNFNTQDTYLGEFGEDVSEDGLTRAFTHMSLRCHPGAPSGAPPELLHQLLATDTHIVSLEQNFSELRNQIKADYGFIYLAPAEIKLEHKHRQQQLNNARKSLTDELHATFRRDYFSRIHNEMMKMSLNQATNQTATDEPGNGTEPMVQHQLKERNELQAVLCDFSRDLAPHVIVSRKITAIKLMIALASRQEPQTRMPRYTSPHEDPVKKEPLSPAPSAEPFPQLDEIPFTLGKDQCIFCIGNEQYSYEKRTRTFKRTSHLWDHVENVHLQHLDAVTACGHHVCKAQGLVLNNVTEFKIHVKEVHGVSLRP
ncbi:hypothetical protein V496_02779 [Pseudogymnoascus sp. VKM F-4515 (FW-2607)]|nr:hypothetical protein V496_02779 [Pseudogymnoascus sp. VKM F-4515 (FW-2607)]